MSICVSTCSSQTCIRNALVSSSFNSYIQGGVKKFQFYLPLNRNIMLMVHGICQNNPLRFCEHMKSYGVHVISLGGNFCDSA
jgi:hypothetical protein